MVRYRIIYQEIYKVGDRNMICIEDYIKDLSPSKEYKESLVKYSSQSIKELDLPDHLVQQLCSASLPIKSDYCVFGENPITFYELPQKKCYALIPDTYIEIAKMEWVGNIAISLTNGFVWQIFPDYYRRSFMNSSIAQYTESLGAWLRFYPQFQDYVADMYDMNPQFSLFDNPEVYSPIKQKLKEIDAKAMESDDNYWVRCCEPDII